MPIRFVDYKGDEVKVPNPKSSFTSIKQRSSDMTRSYYTTGLPSPQYHPEEVKDRYIRWMASADECFYCGRKTIEHLQQDHLIANSHTGHHTGRMVAHTIHEFVPSCSRCNSMKGSKDPVEWYSAPETVDYLKKECNLSDERYAAKLKAMEEDLANLKIYKVDDSFYERSERDLMIKDSVSDILDRMAHDRMSGILQKNGVHHEFKESDLPSDEDFEIWSEIEDVLVRHKRMKKRKCPAKRMNEETDSPLF